MKPESTLPDSAMAAASSDLRSAFFAAAQVQERNVSIESDTSTYSYTLKDVQISKPSSSLRPPGQLSGADTIEPQTRASSIRSQPRRSFSVEIPRSSLAAQSRRSAEQRFGLRAMPSLPEREGVSSPNRSRAVVRYPTEDSIAESVRLNIDPPRGMTVEEVEEADAITGRIVRKRRRLPLPIVIFFGLVSCVCFMLAVAAVTLGSLNWHRISDARASKAIADLRSIIVPLLKAIREAQGGDAR